MVNWREPLAPRPPHELRAVTLQEWEPVVRPVGAHWLELVVVRTVPSTMTSYDDAPDASAQSRREGAVQLVELFAGDTRSNVAGTVATVNPRGPFVLHVTLPAQRAWTFHE